MCHSLRGPLFVALVAILAFVPASALAENVFTLDEVINLRSFFAEINDDRLRALGLSRS